jgi:hypothetical protein
MQKILTRVLSGLMGKNYFFVYKQLRYLFHLCQTRCCGMVSDMLFTWVSTCTPMPG